MNKTLRDQSALQELATIGFRRAKNTEMSSKKTVKQVTNIIELYYAPVAPRERPKIVF